MCGSQLVFLAVYVAVVAVAVTLPLVAQPLPLSRRQPLPRRSRQSPPSSGAPYPYPWSLQPQTSHNNWVVALPDVLEAAQFAHMRSKDDCLQPGTARECKQQGHPDDLLAHHLPMSRVNAALRPEAGMGLPVAAALPHGREIQRQDQDRPMLTDLLQGSANIPSRSLDRSVVHAKPFVHALLLQGLAHACSTRQLPHLTPCGGSASIGA